MANESDYVELGLTCANICKALHRGMDGKELDDFSQSVREAVGQLKTCVEPVTRGLDGSLMILLISEPWRRYRAR